MRHPRERPDSRAGMGRRAFLGRLGAAAATLPSAALLAACERSAPTAAEPRLLPARPNRPVTLPLRDDNPPIEDGLSPETDTTLRVFNWAEYIRPSVVRSFSERYGVKVQVKTFANMDEAIAVLSERGSSFDVMFLRVDVLGKLVQSKMLQPLNHSYLENFENNVWPVYRNPFYDQGGRYTVPYTIYTTGIAWRVDRVDADIPAMANPYDIYWDETYTGKINLFDDYREVLGMALLRNGVTDLNTNRAQYLRGALDDLTELSGLIGDLSIDAYANVPQDKAWIHQAYSGDMVAAPYYFPKGEDPSVVRYWSPSDGRGAVGNDAIAIPRSARNPVLAHHFVDYLLDFDVAMHNYEWNGYQPPLRQLEPGTMVDRGLIPSYLESVIVGKQDFNRGFMELELAPRVDDLWHEAWRRFRDDVEAARR